MSFVYATFAEFLQDELRRRQMRNPSYSLRAFARDVELSPSRMSELMSGEHGCSRTSLRQFSQILKLTEFQTEYLCDLVDAQFARDSLQKELAQERLKKSQTEPQVYEFSADQFKIISAWYHLAILALLETTSGELDAGKIAQRLHIDRMIAINAVQRLERLGLISLDEEGKLSHVERHTLVTDQTAPDAMRAFHSQILAKAQQSMHDLPSHSRFLHTEVLAMAPEAYQEVVECIRKFRTEVVAIAKKYQPKNDVFAVSVQAFPLTTQLPVQE